MCCIMVKGDKLEMADKLDTSDGAHALMTIKGAVS
jgi:hypothetical protein